MPAEGSNTTPPGVMAAAVMAARPRGMGVENCWSAWLSSERRVCVGRRLAILAKAESRAAKAALRKSAGPVFCAEQNRRDLTGVVAGFPVPGAAIRSAEGCLHRSLAASMRSPRSRREKMVGSREDGGGMGNGRDRIGHRQHDGHGRNPRESGNGKARSALSLDRPDSTRPGSPLPLKASQ